MFLLLAIFALEDVWIYIHSLNSDNMSFNVKVSVDQYFTIFSTLSVPNINLDDSHIRLREDLYNSQF